VTGVIEASCKIDINYDAERSDAQIAADIKRALDFNVLVDEGIIGATVNDAYLELTGVLGSREQRNEPYSDVWMMGMESVDVSGQEVVWWAHDEDMRKDKPVDKSDQGICLALRALLINDPCVSMVGIVINVSDGPVTMNGTVDNRKAKRAAVSDAQDGRRALRPEQHRN
jgi:osmotically-inducible protein OsmY